jgi:ATP-binding cassette subfamily A (ABC1) protein 3
MLTPAQLTRIVFWNELFPESSVAISIFWQVLNGWAITSASIFSAMFFNRAQLSGIYSSLGFLLVGLGGYLMDRIAPHTSAVATCSFLFPSMNYIFMLGYMCRYEEQALPINLLRAANGTSTEPSTSRVPGYLFWIFLVLQIVIYPILAVFTEKWIHGSKSRARIIGMNAASQSSLVAIETTGLTKIYPPAFYKRLFTCGKTGDVVAVQDLDLAVRKGQVVCLLGANGSGKTTTLDMIGGLLKLTSGSIRINAAASQIGKVINSNRSLL